jgi:hypothetical protein
VAEGRERVGGLGMRIARVFPRRTSASPSDALAFFGPPSMFDEADEIRVSCTWTWDRPRAEMLAKEWRVVSGNVLLGGPAYDDPGEEFTPGKYLKPGLVFTSRGCPNKCWFCYTPKREGGIRQLEIKDGYNVLDSNLLACADDHIKKVFSMLARQPERPRFTGGIDSELVKPWIAREIVKLKPSSAFFAYDTPSAFEPLADAWGMFKAAGETNSGRAYQVYTLIGYKGDTLEKARARLENVLSLGIMPLAMLYNKGEYADGQGWGMLQREYANKFIVGAKLTKLREEKA